MAKKPFSIRTEEVYHNKFKALAMVLKKDNSDLLKEMLFDLEGKLNDDQQAAFDALMKCWKTDSSQD